MIVRGMKIADTSVAVTVVPSPHHGGLGITRSLGRLGVPVFNVDASRCCPSFFSRYSRGKFIVDVEEIPCESAIEALLEVSRAIPGTSILLPTTDRSAALIADHRDALRRHYILPSPNSSLMHSLLSKKTMHSLASEAGLFVPETFFPQTHSELRQCTNSLPFPWIVKAIEGRIWLRGSKTKVIVRDIAELADLEKKINDSAVARLMVQEYIPGDEDSLWMFNGYFNDYSECLAAFTGRKLRQCPAYTGVASLGRCENNPIVEQSCVYFMKKLRYRGIVDIDLRYDKRDREYKILDVNPRIGSTFRLFLNSNGLDVVRAMYLDVTGQQVPSAPLWAGRKWIVEDLDLVASWKYYLDRRLHLSQWFRSLGGIDEYAFLASDDPLPAVFMLNADIREFIYRSKRRNSTIMPFESRVPARADKKHAYL